MKPIIIYETVEDLFDENEDPIIEVDPVIIMEMRERLSPRKKFSYSEGDHLKEATKNEDKMRNKIAVKELHIEGRRWFQKTYGNTYNTSKTLVVFSDGTTKEFFTEMQYGYDEHFKDLAIQNLVKNGVLPEIREGRNWYHMDFKEHDIEVYTTAIDCLKRELHN